MRLRKTTDQEIIMVAKLSQTMTEAARQLNMHLSSFKTHARRLGVYVPNQGRCGIERNQSYVELPLEEILAGKHPQYTSTPLKKRLFEMGLKRKRCETCGESDQTLSFALDHIDGDNSNHKLCNLRILCPNCHSKTPTYCGRNVRKSGKLLTPDKPLLDLIIKGVDNRTILKKLKMAGAGGNYRRIDRLRKIVEYVQITRPV